MIRNTFSILNGIGEKLEKRLWKDGILTWNDFIRANDLTFFSHERKVFFNSSLSHAARKLDEGDAPFFAKTVRRREHWRLFEIFRKDALYLDIETNGLQPGRGGYVTVVGLYDGYDWRSLIAGENLTAGSLRQAFSGYKCLITFYGSSFDIPFLQRSFPAVRFDLPHFDLCFAAKRLGISGGLKKIETLFAIERSEDVKGMDGYDAVRLWELARRGNDEAKRLLLSYNREDTVNLMRIADIPFLQRSFPAVRFDLPHFDLCFAAKRLGISGGLKKIETLFAIERSEDVKGMNGYDAVRLWELARRGNDEAKRLLLSYNREDTVNLMRIADILYHRLKRSTGIEEHLVCGYT